MKRFGEINGTSVLISDHALARMIEMEITPEEFKALITDPEYVYESLKYPEATCQRRGKFAIALKKGESMHFVITLLYATIDDWYDAAKDGRLGDKRVLKPNLNLPRRR